jgi:hypothetical protein
MERRRSLLVLVAGLVVLSGVSLPAAANTVVSGEPDLSVSSPTEPVQASERTTLTVTLANDGDLSQGDLDRPDYEAQVQTARNVKVRIPESAIDAPIDVRTGTLSIGRLGSPDSRDLSFALEVGEAAPGTYRIPIEVEYDYTSSIVYGPFEQPEFVRTSDTVRTSVRLRVEDRAQFEVVSEGSNRLFAGDTGDLSFAIENVGSRTASRASVRLTSGTSGVYFGAPDDRQRQTSLFLRSLEPGESRNLSTQVGASAETMPGSYPIETVVIYQNTNDVRQESDALRTGVTVRAEREFVLRDVETERLRVDESEARLTGEIVNRGEGTARAVSVRMAESGSITPTNGESAVGDLAPGEAKPVAFTVSVPGDAEPGTNTVRFDVEYENGAGDLRRADEPLRQSVTVGPEREQFEVVDVATTVSPGASATLDVEVRYTGTEPVSAVNAKLFASDPLSSADDGAFLGRMAPGSTTTASFRVSAAGNALVKEYASALQVRYEEADGDTKFTDDLSIGVPVSESEGDGPPLVPIAVGAVVVLALVGYAVVRRA